MINLGHPAFCHHCQPLEWRSCPCRITTQPLLSCISDAEDSKKQIQHHTFGHGKWGRSSRSAAQCVCMSTYTHRCMPGLTILLTCHSTFSWKKCLRRCACLRACERLTFKKINDIKRILWLLISAFVCACVDVCVHVCVCGEGGLSLLRSLTKPLRGRVWRHTAFPFGYWATGFVTDRNRHKQISLKGLKTNSYEGSKQVSHRGRQRRSEGAGMWLCLCQRKIKVAFCIASSYDCHLLWD